MKRHPPFPSASAYTSTNGWGERKVSQVAMSGDTNRNRIVAANPQRPDATAERNRPREATTEAFLVSSATCPLASKPMMGPVA